MNHGFDILGAELPRKLQPLPAKRTMIALGAGVLGAVLVKKHPVLAFLGTAALASNVHAVAAGERTFKQAVQRMGRHVVATAGSLSVPKYPAMGYVAGAVAAEMFIDGEGGGLIEEFTDYEGITSRPRGEVIDAEFVETKSPGVALQKVT
jgi:hypothetical protein